MPHQRERLLLNQIQKKLRLYPSIAIIGARQTGKSTLLCEILAKKVELDYFTMDSKNTKERAENNPDSFSELENHRLKVFDEVQKVPQLFDSVKLHIDQNRRPGMYLLSGSTEFSSFTGIRESLTGRIGVLRLYPFNLSEIHKKSFGAYWSEKSQSHSLINLFEFEKKLKRGGMPGFFYLHSDQEWSDFCQSWIETTCFRDLGRIVKTNFDPDLALNIFSTICRSFTPTVAEIASTLKKDSRIIKKYLDGFVRILVLHKISPHKSSVGKEHYLPVDSSFAHYFGSDDDSLLRIHVLSEALSFFENNGLGRPQMQYYKSSKKSFIPLIFYWAQKDFTLSVQLSNSESPSRGEIASILSFQKKLKSNNHREILLNHSTESYFEDNLEFHPLRG